MKESVIMRLQTKFETVIQEEGDTEYWLARELQPLLGYAKRRNFEQVVEKARVACSTARMSVDDHFADVGKMIVVGSFAPRSLPHIGLSA